MTDPTRPPAAAPGCPTATATLSDLAGRAHRLQALIGALVLIHDASPPHLPSDATLAERQAREAWPPMLDVIEGESTALARALDQAHASSLHRAGA